MVSVFEPMEDFCNKGFLTTAFFGEDLKIPSYDWQDTAVDQKMQRDKINKKRKSMEIDESPLVNSGSMKFALEPIPFSYLEGVSSDDGFDVELFAQLILDTEEIKQESGIAKMQNKLVNSRKSEDWDSTPLSKRSSFFEDDLNKKRLKWSKAELNMLWSSIAIHGNNWALINDILTTRSYYQIKDKGRRILYDHGWITGRNKKDSEIANRSAREIAKKMLAKR